MQSTKTWAVTLLGKTELSPLRLGELGRLLVLHAAHDRVEHFGVASDSFRSRSQRKAYPTASQRLHPQTAHGVAGAEARHGRADDKLSFAADQASKTGENERTVQRNAERGEKINPSALALVKGTALDTGVYLDKVSG